jgi:hypothetical protein
VVQTRQVATWRFAHKTKTSEMDSWASRKLSHTLTIIHLRAPFVDHCFQIGISISLGDT